MPNNLFQAAFAPPPDPMTMERTLDRDADPNRVPASTTPAPVQPAVPAPGTPLPVQTTAQPKPPARTAPTPMPKPVQPADPGATTPVPKPTRGADDAIPVPKPGARVPDAIPVPKPGARPAPGSGGGSAPPAGGGSGGGGGGSAGGRVGMMDYRQGLSENDRDAVTREVSADELTSEQLSRLLDENGRYIQSARLRAREGAAASGMLMSSVAQGAAERAAIDAGLPIAQSDASVYANTASENMRARNDDAMADQSQGRSLFGQAMGIRAQLDDSQANRGWQSSENSMERQWRSSEAGLDREHQGNMQANEFGWRSSEAGLDRSFNERMQNLQNQFQRQENETERDWRDRVAALDREFNADQNSQERYQRRFDSYANMMALREQSLAQQLSAIYSNPELTPDQQRQAAENARAVFTSVTSSFNAAFAQGLPEIFASPYNMPAGTGGSTGGQTPPTTPAPPTGSGGGQGDDSGGWDPRSAQIARIKGGG